MDNAQVQDLARTIVDGALLGAWKYVAIYGALLFLGTLATAYFAAWASSRGKHAALEADFNKILRQLEHTTSVSESIKTSVQHAGWQNKEYNTVRRTKLEEFFVAMLECDKYISTLTEWWFKDGFAQPEGMNPSFKLRMLGKLYFPEIDLSKFQQAFIDQRKLIIDGKRLLRQAKARGVEAEFDATLAQVQATYIASSEPFHGALVALEEACAQIMQTTIEPTVADAAQKQTAP